MKTIIKVIGVLLCIAAAIAYYLYNRVSYQPEWYLEDKGVGEFQFTGNVDDLERKIKQGLQNGESVRIPANRMIDLVADQLEKKTGFEIKEAIKAAKTTIDPSGVEVEMIVDMRLIPPEKLPKDAQKAFKQFLGLVPKNALNNLYIKCNMQALKQEGSVSLDPLSSISIGKMNLPVAELKKKIGSKRTFSLESLPISDVEFEKDAIILKP
uniref:Uncharacterized protein n=1 Tax=Candidatus Desulfatibia profunda TaxID=2841695 RepID=A0A8J6NQH6_9BACT|nr:hypothetical protein [Candidatus Desulfatibia profunda]